MSPLHGPGAPVEGGAAPSDIPRQRAETAHVRPMFGQIAQAIARNLPDGVVEVRLHPEELGRLRLAITPADAGYSVQVTAERPETLELVRRHIDLLASDMRERGFGSLDFSFGRDGGAAGASFEELADATPKDETPTGDGLQATLTNRPAAIAPGRVDMRI